MEYRNWDDPENHGCRTCKHLIYAGPKPVVCGFDKNRPMYDQGKRITILDCPTWELTTDNLKPPFKK